MNGLFPQFYKSDFLVYNIIHQKHLHKGEVNMAKDEGKKIVQEGEKIFKEAGGDVKGAAEKIFHKAEEAAEKVKDKTEEAAEKVKDKAEDAVDSVKDKVKK